MQAIITTKEAWVIEDIELCDLPAGSPFHYYGKRYITYQVKGKNFNPRKQRVWFTKDIVKQGGRIVNQNTHPEYFL